MNKIIKTNDGYMIELPDGDYMCDADGNNLFDTFAEACSLARDTDTLTDGQTNWGKANDAFYEWEKFYYGDDSDLSDDDRMLWIEGYLQALRDAS